MNFIVQQLRSLPFKYDGSDSHKYVTHKKIIDFISKDKYKLIIINPLFDLKKYNQ